MIRARCQQHHNEFLLEEEANDVNRSTAKCSCIWYEDLEFWLPKLGWIKAEYYDGACYQYILRDGEVYSVEEEYNRPGGWIHVYRNICDRMEFILSGLIVVEDKNL